MLFFKTASNFKGSNWFYAIFHQGYFSRMDSCNARFKIVIIKVNNCKIKLNFNKLELDCNSKLALFFYVVKLVLLLEHIYVDNSIICSTIYLLSSSNFITTYLHSYKETKVGQWKINFFSLFFKENFIFYLKL